MEAVEESGAVGGLPACPKSSPVPVFVTLGDSAVFAVVGGEAGGDAFWEVACVNVDAALVAV